MIKIRNITPWLLPSGISSGYRSWFDKILTLIWRSCKFFHRGPWKKKKVVPTPISVRLGQEEDKVVNSFNIFHIIFYSHWQEAVGDTLEELWISYNLIEKLKGINVLRNLKVLYMSNNLVKEWSEFNKLQVNRKTYANPNKSKLSVKFIAFAKCNF